MDKWSIRQSVDLALSGNGPYIWPDALMVAGDRMAHTWEITINHGGKAASLEGAQATAYFNRADNVAVALAGTVNDNVASVTMAQECYAVEGPLIGIFRLTTADGETLTISVIRFSVRKGPYDAVVDPGEVIPSLPDLLAQIQAMEAATEAANAVAARWDTTSLEVEMLEPDEPATGSFTQTNNTTTVHFNIPRGQRGPAGGNITTAAELPTADGSDVETKLEQIDAAGLWREAVGNPATCYPVPGSRMHLKVALIATQLGSGDPSLENVRTISPALTSGATLHMKRTGKNLIPRHEMASVTNNGVTFTIQNDGSVLLTGTPTAQATFAYQGVTPFTEDVITLEPGNYVAKKTGYSSIALQLFDWSAGQTALTTPVTTSDKAISLASEFKVDYVRMLVAMGTSLGTGVVVYPQLERGSVATEYEPYDGNVYEWTAPQDIYGFSGAETLVDFDARELVVQDEVIAFRGTETWGKSTSGDNTNFFISGYAAKSTSGIRCSHCPTSLSGTAPTTGFAVLYNVNARLIVFTGITANMPSDAAGWNAMIAAEYAAGRPMTVQIQRVSPIRIPLIDIPGIYAIPQLDRYTPRQNLLAADLGSLTVGYHKSPIREYDEIQAAIAALA